MDSSAAAIAAQGLLRLGRILSNSSETSAGTPSVASAFRRKSLAPSPKDGARYMQAGLQVLATLLDDQGPYLSTTSTHQGLLLHSVYHRPNGWDHIPSGAHVPRGESSQWGDYHLREAALLARRLASGDRYPTFFAAR